MRQGAKLLLLVLTVLTAAIIAVGCGGSNSLAPAESLGVEQTLSGEPVANLQDINGVPQALPTDGLQPWETLSPAGYAVPADNTKFSSSLTANSEFVVGSERFLEGGDVTDLGSASHLASGAAGAGELSFAQYRINMLGTQPGTIAVDVNLLLRDDSTPSEYWIGVSNYTSGTWDWHGPINTAHARISTTAPDQLSGLGNLFVTIMAFDGSRFNVVGVGTEARTLGDLVPPAVPDAPTLTPLTGGMLVEWTPVGDPDLAGYRIYYSSAPFTPLPAEYNIHHVATLESETSYVFTGLNDTRWVRLSAVDYSGNESAASAMVSATPLAGSPLVIEFTTDIVSGLLGDTATLTATGAEMYDFDVDGDGLYEITGDLTGTTSLLAENTGLFRPHVRGYSGITMQPASLSLLIGGNSRPVASCTADPQFGYAPVSVTFSGIADDAEDLPGELTYAWDFNGDGIYEAGSNTLNPSPKLYSYAGTYNIKFRVVDTDGSWDVDTVTINALYPSGFEKTYVGEPGSGVYPDIALVGGRPAMAYYHSGPGYLMFQRAIDPVGTIWDTPIVVVASAGAGQYCDLKVINGIPAIAYYDGSLNEVQYIRADNAEGSSWTAAPVVISPGNVSEDVSLAYVNGNPAVAYTDTAVGVLTYRRASSGAGTGQTIADWTDPAVVIDPAGSLINGASLAVIDGKPAVAYVDNVGPRCRYKRAINSTGQTGGDWPGASIEIGVGVDCGGWPTLLEVNGRPAISFYESSIGSVQYMRALNATGNTAGDWPAGMTQIDTGFGAGMFLTMAIVNGQPAVAYQKSPGFVGLFYSPATDVNGSSWTAPESVLDAFIGTIGLYNSLMDLNGHPAIASYATPPNTGMYSYRPY